MARTSSKSTRLRTALVCCYLALGSIHFIAAFVLAWFSKDDARAFLLSGILTAGWAFVVANDTNGDDARPVDFPEDSQR